MASQIKITAILIALPGQTESLRSLLDFMAPRSRSEKGNLRWDLWQDSSNPHRYVIDELYKDSDAAAAHRETAHYKYYLGRINDLAERTAISLHAANVANYDARPVPIPGATLDI